MRFFVPPRVLIVVIFVVALTLAKTTNLTGPEVALTCAGLGAVMTGPQFVSAVRALRRRSGKDKT